jgi:hypothetical protein
MGHRPIPFVQWPPERRPRKNPGRLGHPGSVRTLGEARPPMCGRRSDDARMQRGRAGQSRRVISRCLDGCVRHHVTSEIMLGAATSTARGWPQPAARSSPPYLSRRRPGPSWRTEVTSRIAPLRLLSRLGPGLRRERKLKRYAPCARLIASSSASTGATATSGAMPPPSQSSPVSGSIVRPTGRNTASPAPMLSKPPK